MAPSFTGEHWKSYLEFKPKRKHLGLFALYSLNNFSSAFVGELSYPPDIFAIKRDVNKREEFPIDLGKMVYFIMENNGRISRSALIERMQDERLVSRSSTGAKESIDRLLGEFRELMHEDENYPILLTQVAAPYRETHYVLDGFVEPYNVVNNLAYGRISGRVLEIKRYGKKDSIIATRQTSISLTQRELECLDYIVEKEGRYVKMSGLISLPTIKNIDNDKEKAVKDALIRALKKLNAPNAVNYDQKKGFMYKAK